MRGKGRARFARCAVKTFGFRSLRSLLRKIESRPEAMTNDGEALPPLLPCVTLHRDGESHPPLSSHHSTASPTHFACSIFCGPGGGGGLEGRENCMGRARAGQYPSNFITLPPLLSRPTCPPPTLPSARPISFPIFFALLADKQQNNRPLLASLLPNLKIILIQNI